MALAIPFVARITGEVDRFDQVEAAAVPVPDAVDVKSGKSQEVFGIRRDPNFGQQPRRDEGTPLFNLGDDEPTPRNPPPPGLRGIPT